MEEIKIYEEPLSKEEFTEHSIKKSIREMPCNYHLIDIIKDLKFGRPAENQRMMDEWIAMMELAPERGAPFSKAIVDVVFGGGGDEVLPDNDDDIRI